MEYFTDIDTNGNPSPKVMNQIFRDLFIYVGKRICIKVDKVKSTRSIAQNNLYWAWLTLLQNETGIDKNEFHELFKHLFLTTIKQNPITGDDYPSVGSTTKLSKSEFTELADKISLWVLENLQTSERKIKLPMPDEAWELTFK